MKKRISNAQRITLIARTAWGKLTSAGAIDESFDDWRQRESLDCCGVRISKATSPQLDRLETHFLALSGQTSKAFDQATGEDGRTKRQRHAIQLLADQLNLDPQYAATMPAHQLKGVLINLTKRARSAKKAH